MARIAELEADNRSLREYLRLSNVQRDVFGEHLERCRQIIGGDCTSVPDEVAALKAEVAALKAEAAGMLIRDPAHRTK